MDAGVPEENLRRAGEDSQCTDKDWRVRKGGARFWARATVTALYDEEGALRGFAKVTRDMELQHLRSDRPPAGERRR